MPIVTTRWDSRLPQLSRAGAIVTALIGVAVLFGWTFGVTFLKSGLPSLASMKPNTAVAFVACGVSLWLCHGSPARDRRMTGVLLGVFVVAVALATLMQDLAGTDLGIDELLFRDDPGGPGTPHGGRMSPVTAVSFSFAGVALILIHLGEGWLRRWVPWCAVLVASMGALAAIGYAFGVNSLYRIGIYSSMAVHTAAAFCLLSVALLAAVPSTGFMKTVTSGTAGGFVARRLLMLIPVSLFALGGVCVAGEQAGWYDARFGLVLMVVLSMLFSAGLVLWHADVLYRVDLERLQAGVEIVALNAGLERKVQERTQELQTALDEVKQLKGLLPICSWCKKIRDDKDYWLSVEDFISAHTDARFSHGVCPACFEKFVQDNPSSV